MPQTEAPESFRHEALFYAGDEEFLAGTVPFVRDGLAAGEPILVALPDRRAAALERALGHHAGGVCFVDMEQLGRNPGRIISAWRDFVDARPARCPGVRGIGEPAWPGRSAQELDECRRHEALLNAACADGPDLVLLCPYDVEGLPEAVVQEARGTHPYVCQRGASAASDTYLPPGHDVFAGDLPPAPPDADVLRFDARTLRVVRALVDDRALRAGLGSGRRADLVSAATELAANSVSHAGGRGTLRVWRDGSALAVEVEDAGQLDDPLVGRLRPPLDQPHGRGLWLVHQLSDLVQVRSFGGRTRVRARMDLAAA
jgi:anti-sigma regulatory factor (Ser/Thr protein kinase)